MHPFQNSVTLETLKFTIFDVYYNYTTNYHLKNQRKISLLSSKRAAFNYYIQHFHEGTTSSGRWSIKSLNPLKLRRINSNPFCFSQLNFKNIKTWIFFTFERTCENKASKTALINASMPKFFTVYSHFPISNNFERHECNQGERCECQI